MRTLVLLLALSLGCGRAAELVGMPTCRKMVQDDLNEFVADKFDARVEKCTGDDRDATCFVSSLLRGNRVTGALKSWDCTVRHLKAVDQGAGKSFDPAAVAYVRTRVEDLRNQVEGK